MPYVTYVAAIGLNCSIFLDVPLGPIKSDFLEHLPCAKPFGQHSGLNMFPVCKKLALNLDYRK